MHEVVELERALLTPAVRRSRGQLDALLDLDFHEIGASGRLWTRAEMLASLVEGDEPDRAVEAEEFRCLEAGPGLVVLTYVSDPRGRAARRTSLWRRSEGRWLLHHQGTLLPQPHGGGVGS